jgi:uncharacterized protein (TIGR02453 family)
LDFLSDGPTVGSEETVEVREKVCFTKDALAYLQELQQNNNKKWFEANRLRYEESLRKPMLSLAATMIERMKRIDPLIDQTPEDALFQMGRDVRLSIDKSPYKTHVGMLICRKGPDSFAHPGLYVQVAPTGLGIASGFHALEPAQSIAIRRLLMANPEEFTKRLSDRTFKSHFVSIRGEANKLLPPEFRDAAATQPLIYNKQFYYWAEHEAQSALRDDLPDFIMKHMDACAPMNEFLMRAFDHVAPNSATSAAAESRD